MHFTPIRFKDKSDVYSFGVVLIELISSMVADDAARERYQANLANLTMKKMQKVKLSELVDPFFGFESDQVVKRILTSVVGLAFRCMQGDNELSPSMDEVLEALNKFQNENYESENREKEDNDGVISSTSSTKVHPPQPASQDSGQVGILMNNKLLRSPNSLTEKLEGWYVDLELATRLSKFEEKMIKNLQNQKWQKEQQTREPTGQLLCSQHFPPYELTNPATKRTHGPDFNILKGERFEQDKGLSTHVPKSRK
ncbi:hypothetical protein JHK84_044928 [Glycine max]|uniref:Putative serine/threonine-protein kinase n=1 Tax=Glycine soja TaxID=3848 RepID=A0A0B2QGS5_GLYSO|nr:hypothetical protein JHK86_044817 [Glycine max]KAG4951567.1 hypothetical protein JHK85_045434 [Glycine max]KAG5108021.1 hypothetical protein JHK84_044928 [Glycine max]KHN20430.1 Putative serine/threonine-protein kinase [Glycine soja]